jgi:Transglutaminase-like superfamily/Coenzyme PQQ synthesis protein D (PqqD)
VKDGMLTMLTAVTNPAKGDNAPAAIRLGQDVFLVQADGVARLLDFDRGRFYALNPVASRMLTLSLEQGTAEAATRLAAEYEISPRRIEADLAVLLRDLQGKRLLVSPDRPCHTGARTGAALGGVLRGADLALFRPLRAAAAAVVRLFRRPDEGSRGVPSVPGRLTVGLLLSLAWVSLRLFGWTGTLALWRRWHRSPTGPGPAARGRVLETLDGVVRDAAVGKLCFPASCKERALVGYQVLRACYGLPATLVVGVQCHPFGAHAWVKCDGRVITDDPARCELYTPVARYH